MATFYQGDKWQGYDQNFWFSTTLQLDETYEGKNVWFEVITGREHCWDNITPQLKVFLNGEFVQGLTLNHREFEVCKAANKDVSYEILLLHSDTVMDDVPLDLNCHIYALNQDVEMLYYHIKVIMGVVETLLRECSDDFASYYLFNSVPLPLSCLLSSYQSEPSILIKNLTFFDEYMASWFRTEPSGYEKRMCKLKTSDALVEVLPQLIKRIWIS